MDMTFVCKLALQAGCRWIFTRRFWIKAMEIFMRPATFVLNRSLV